MIFFSIYNFYNFVYRMQKENFKGSFQIESFREILRKLIIVYFVEEIVLKLK